MLSVGYFCKRTFYRNTVKWVHIYLYSCTVFAVHGLRFSAVSGHFCMVVIKSVLKLETQIYIKCHPNKSKEKLCYSYVYNAIHIHTKNSQCGIRYCPLSKTTTVCLAFCIDHSFMRYSIKYIRI